jgi:hypothetical protein
MKPKKSFLRQIIVNGFPIRFRIESEIVVQTDVEIEFILERSQFGVRNFTVRVHRIDMNVIRIQEIKIQQQFVIMSRRPQDQFDVLPVGHQFHGFFRVRIIFEIFFFAVCRFENSSVQIYRDVNVIPVFFFFLLESSFKRCNNVHSFLRLRGPDKNVMIRTGGTRFVHVLICEIIPASAYRDAAQEFVFVFRNDFFHQSGTDTFVSELFRDNDRRKINELGILDEKVRIDIYVVGQNTRNYRIVKFFFDWNRAHVTDDVFFVIRDKHGMMRFVSRFVPFFR